MLSFAQNVLFNVLTLKPAREKNRSSCEDYSPRYITIKISIKLLPLSYRVSSAYFPFLNYVKTILTVVVVVTTIVMIIQV